VGAPGRGRSVAPGVDFLRSREPRRGYFLITRDQTISRARITGASGGCATSGSSTRTPNGLKVWSLRCTPKGGLRHESAVHDFEILDCSGASHVEEILGERRGSAHDGPAVGRGCARLCSTTTRSHLERLVTAENWQTTRPRDRTPAPWIRSRALGAGNG
jgi:hypothetical protein